MGAKRLKTQELIIFVGTCAFGGAETRSVFQLGLCLKTGKLTLVGAPIDVGIDNPGWLICCKSSGRMYAGSESDFGLVQAYTIKGAGTAACSIELLGNAVSAVGAGTCHLGFDMSGKWLFVANYTEGSVSVVRVLQDGSLSHPRDSKMHQGCLPIEFHDRQEKPHAHQCLVHPSNTWVLVCDLGLSTVFVYEFDAEYGAIVGAADDPRHLRLPHGAGPRHAAWANNGSRLFVTNELDCTLTVCDFDVADGKLTAKKTFATLPEGVAPLRPHHRGNSDIHVHPNGRFLYVACRSPDPGVITVFAIDGENLSVVQHESTGGMVPLNFKLLDDGRWLVVGNQETMTISCFVVDSETGKLQLAGEVQTALKPCNIAPLL